MWDAKSNVQLKILLCFFFLFLFPVVSFVTFLTIFDCLVLENCRMGLLFQRLGVQCLAMLSNPCLFPALEQGNRRKAKGSMWRVCSKDVEMNHFNQLTFQPGNQTCLWLWVLCGTPFFPQEFSLSPFLCISECDLYLRADRFRTGFVWSHILAPVVVRGRWRVIGSAWIFGGFFYCATALSLQTKWMGPRAAGLRGAVATSSGWLVWSGFHEMGYFMS